MIKNFLFYFSAGVVTPLYISAVSASGHISIVFSIDSILVGLAALYLGRLADRIGVQKLFYVFVPLSMISILNVHFLMAQILYGISISIIGLLINIDTSNQKGSSGVNFGRLTFYTQLAVALSILLGGLITGNGAVAIYITLMLAFLIKPLV